MNRTQKTIGGILAIIFFVILIIVFASIAWVSYSSFYDSAMNQSLWKWSDFDRMVTGLILLGFFAGFLFGIVSYASGIVQLTRRERERQKPKEEIKEELQNENQPPPPLQS